jgi:D-alanine-D-alanine ligase
VNYNIKFDSYKIWVLAPGIETEDENLAYYYDFSQSIAEYTKVFNDLNLEWEWITVYNHTIISTIHRIVESNSDKMPLVINLCDGDDTNEVPGINVIYELEKHGLIYTGAQEYFYKITTSKIPMKHKFDLAQIPNAAWEVIDPDGNNIPRIFDRLGRPLIIKPAVSGGSMGLGIKNVVDSEDDCREQLLRIQNGYRGWKLDSGGVFAEKFIIGQEFTTFLVGSYLKPEEIIFYTPIERVFNQDIPVTEQFLSFDRLWETYEEEMPLEQDAFLFNYVKPEDQVIPILKKLSIDAFIALKGTGYTRIDFRRDASSGSFYVLEANAQCGISEDENFTSIGAILRVSNISFTALVCDIMEEAIRRNQ